MPTEVQQFIWSHWDDTIRVTKEDNGRLIGLPRPYTVPCIENMFQEMYYWDTYFTNVGLMLSGKTEQARNNAENMAFLIQKYGKMLNGSTVGFLNRSQPPFFSQMVREIFEKTGDREWLGEMFPSVKREHAFWQTNRMTPSGLNRYYCDNPEDFNRAHAGWLCERCHLEIPESEEEIREYAQCFLAFAESGWDCTSRFGLRAHEFNPVCLNALLYGMEANLAYFAQVLENGEEAHWTALAEERKGRMNTYMWDESLGAFLDYDFRRNEKGGLFSAASFYPLTFGLATPEQAARTVALLPRIEREFGVSCCEAREGIMSLQWDEPNGWACLQYMVIRGLLNYGYREEALRIARKYAGVVEKNFRETGNLWEKYNVVAGTVSTATEYETPTMMGWSAGVYLYVCALLEENGEKEA